MSTSDATHNAVNGHLLETRLDAIDQALLGVIPRNERLAIAAQLETRIRELSSNNPAVETLLSPVISQSFIPTIRGIAATGLKRSRLALSSGVLGIVALVLLCGVPFTYLAVSVVGEFVGEVVALSLIGGHLLAVTVGGLTAVGLGAAALVKLGRRRDVLAGHGWAIAGLCTGPLALFVGGSVLVLGAFEMLGTGFISVQNVAAVAAPNQGIPSTADAAEAPDGFDPGCSPAYGMSAPVAYRSAPGTVGSLASGPLEGLVPSDAPTASTVPFVSEPPPPSSPEKPDPIEDCAASVIIPESTGRTTRATAPISPETPAEDVR